MKYWIIFLTCCVLFSCAEKKVAEPLMENTDQHKEPTMAPFYHGVASGDPDQSSLVIWTRVTPEQNEESISVDWVVSSDEEFQEVVQRGVFETGPQRDYTVKVLVENLSAGSKYYYRFKVADDLSPTGRTRTAPDNGESLKFAVASCSNFEWGYFNAYRAMAEQEDLAAVLHLGDYIYEYGIGRYGDTSIGRLNIPPHEIVSLQDYRDRYALYRLDPDLQAAHQNHPFIAIWDDHEITNNSYKSGAQNHQENEGSYETRKSIARQVYYEWMPIREMDHHYRYFPFGSLADVIMLDERLEARSQQADSLTDPRFMDPAQAMIGPSQLQWFSDHLNNSTAKWKLIGNQVIFSSLDWGRPNFSINLDAWDGYPVEQKKVANIIKENKIENVVFLTGDTHSSWAFEVTLDPHDEYKREGAFAIEFGTTSINSANTDEGNPVDTAINREKRVMDPALNPHLKYSNMRDHGFILLTVTEDQLLSEYIFVETVKTRSNNHHVEKSFVVPAGSNTLQQDL